jgi:hypothetical protein
MIVKSNTVLITDRPAQRQKRTDNNNIKKAYEQLYYTRRLFLWYRGNIDRPDNEEASTTFFFYTFC